MKIIFLDIDGVLIKWDNIGSINPYWSFVDEFDRSCINNLLYIIEKTWAKLVISSSWRHELWSLRKTWLSYWLDWDLIIWVTPSKTNKGRNWEIKQWLAWNPNITDWITIDDCYYSLDWCREQNRLVQPDVNKWLTREEARIAINILNNNV